MSMENHVGGGRQGGMIGRQNLTNQNTVSATNDSPAPSMNITVDASGKRLRLAIRIIETADMWASWIILLRREDEKGGGGGKGSSSSTMRRTNLLIRKVAALLRSYTVQMGILNAHREVEEL